MGCASLTKLCQHLLSNAVQMVAAGDVIFLQLEAYLAAARAFDGIVCCFEIFDPA
jgi:hypothetical protein